ncbi:MAG: EAL domain-containing protein [Oceanospirillaceae bacterium]
MTNSNARFSSLICSIFLVVVVASIISSFYVHREVKGMQLNPDRIERILFMRQYEYELLRTTTAYVEAYSATPSDLLSRQYFNNWFSVLWSRANSISEGSVGAAAIEDGFNIEDLQQSLIVIDRLVYESEVLSLENYSTSLDLFKRLTESSHDYQQQRNSVHREISLQRQINFFQYFKAEFVLHMLTLILGIFVALYLARANKKLLGLGVKLEDLVKQRTEKLSYTNIRLINEIEKKQLTEERLLESQSQIERAKKKAEQKANYDSLTTLASKTLFNDRFEQALIRSRKAKTEVALLFLDLDRFKNINDTCGHNTGDQLLKMAAQRINSVLRDGDTAARFGGDEFALLLPDIKSFTSIEHIVDQIMIELRKPYNLSGNSTVVSASIGITLFPKDGEDTETLLRKADRAMYKAKENGRNNVQLFTQAMDDDAHARLFLETALYKAIEKKEFQVYYQAIVNNLNNKVTGAEALIRWPHETLGMIPPSKFIPIAEDMDLILEIGEWVLYTACRDVQRWQTAEGNPITVSVNVSYRQFIKQDFPDLVRKVLQKTGLAAQFLILEITERLLIEENQAVLAQFEELVSMGVELAIDDFGTGFSSLSYLNKFPISILKIDRSFIQDITESKDHAELVKAILSMAFNLNLRVIAEGIETSEQAKFLIDNNCTYCQGYYFGKPAALASFEKDFKKKNRIGSNTQQEVGESKLGTVTHMNLTDNSLIVLPSN